ncbi:hypothetical protein [Sorangium sp. So ce131]|uniref:hypothetical protein n=1 Tax=Sorangium sp. So ce131 TaxID=3133282 RepID=UPI003F63B44E
MRYPCLSILGAALLARPSVASAADGARLNGNPPVEGASASSSVGERAAQLYREGNKFYDEAKFVEAEARYQAAWDLQKSFDVAGNLGNVELELKQAREAAEHLAYALEAFPLGERAEKRQFLKDRLAQAKSQVGTLRISVNVDNAEVFVDGKLIGLSPLQGEVFVDPGKRDIEARRAGARTSTSLLVARGSDQNIALSLDTGPSIPLVVAGGAVGLLGIASGVTFAFLSTSQGEYADGEPRHSQERAELRRTQTTFANLSFWSFVGSGVVLAGTAVYVFSTSSRAPSPHAGLTGFRAVPLVTSEVAGMLVGASF